MKEIPHQSFQEAITLALVQVLPHCIMGEWQCIMGMLKQLLANEILCVPCSTQYLTELPMVNISGIEHVCATLMTNWAQIITGVLFYAFVWIHQVGRLVCGALTNLFGAFNFIVLFIVILSVCRVQSSPQLFSAASISDATSDQPLLSRLGNPTASPSCDPLPR